MVLTLLTCWLVLSSAVVAGFAPTDSGDAAVASSDHSNATASGEVLTPSEILNSLRAQAGPNVNTSNDSFGWSVASGDFDGDGATDVIVGAPGRGENNTGGVYLFYGPVTAMNISISDADVTLYGESSGDYAGWSVDSGDIDGNGYSDIVVGAPYNDEGGEDAGATYVIFGGDTLHGTIPLGGVHTKLVGDRAGGQAGFDVSARTVDSPDAPGLLIGAPASGADGQSGSAYLVAGETLPNETTMFLDPEKQSLNATKTKFVGRATDDRAGWSVEWVGDVNDDGTVEVAVGAPYYNESGDARVGAVALFGANASGVKYLNQSAAMLVGESAYDSVGFSVGSAGDFDGDGVADLLLGAPSNDTRGQNAGAAYVVYGSSSLDGTRTVSDADVTVFGEQSGDLLGWSLTGAGDLDCDGNDDVVISAPTHGDTGTAYIIYGQSSAGSAAVTKLVGSDLGDFTGASLTAVPRADSNASDVLIGAPGSDIGSLDSGAVYLLRSQNECGLGSGGDEATGNPTTTGSDGSNASQDFRYAGGDGTSEPSRVDGDDSAEIGGQSVSDADSDATEGQVVAGSGGDGDRTEASGDNSENADERDHAVQTPRSPEDQSPGDSDDGSSEDDDSDDGSSGDDGESDGPDENPDSGDGDGSDGPDENPDSGDGRDSPPENEAQEQRQSISVYQNQCQRQTGSGDQRQSQDQSVYGGQVQAGSDESVRVRWQYQRINVVQNQCQFQGDGHDNVQQQRQHLVIRFSQQQSDGGGEQSQSESVDAGQTQAQRQSDSEQAQTQVQWFSVTFVQTQSRAEVERQSQSQNIDIDQTQEQSQGDGYEQIQTQFQIVRIVHQGQSQTYGDTQQAQNQSVEASQRQHQEQTNVSQNQTENQSVEVQQNQTQTQRDRNLTQTQNQSVDVDQGQNQSQGDNETNQTQSQNQSVTAGQNQTEEGGENQTQAQNQTVDLNQSQTQNQSQTGANESQSGEADADQNQTQEQYGDDNTQSQNETIAGEQNQTQTQNESNLTTTFPGKSQNASENVSASNATNRSDEDLTTQTVEAGDIEAADEETTTEETTEEETVDADDEETEETTEETTTEETTTEETTTTTETTATTTETTTTEEMQEEQTDEETTEEETQEEPQDETTEEEPTEETTEETTTEETTTKETQEKQTEETTTEETQEEPQDETTEEEPTEDETTEETTTEETTTEEEQTEEETTTTEEDADGEDELTTSEGEENTTTGDENGNVEVSPLDSARRAAV